jgi:hypothetical protein
MIAHRNPITGITWLYPTLGPSRPLTADEAERLADAMPAEFYMDYLLPGFACVLTPAWLEAVGILSPTGCPVGQTPDPDARPEPMPNLYTAGSSPPANLDDGSDLA